MKKLMTMTCLLLLLFSACQQEFSGSRMPHPKANRSTVKPAATIDLNRLIDSLHYNRNHVHIEIQKSAYRMKVFYDTVLLKEYPVVLGFNPVEDKLRQGDGCTPEGTFRIRARYPHAEWSKFIWIDYPNKDSWQKHQRAKREGRIPARASIGGEVGIHGVPAGYDYLIDQRENWTLGCISLCTRDIDELYRALGPNSYVVIKH